MKFESLDIVVFTTTAPESIDRQNRIRQYLANASITDYKFHTCDIGKYLPMPSGIDLKLPSYYDHAMAFADVLKSDRDILFLEDDVIIDNNFKEQVDYHLSIIPKDFFIFVGGHNFAQNYVPQHQCFGTVDYFYGMQCMVIRAAKAKSLINAIYDGSIFALCNREGIDNALSPWCRTMDYGLYVAREPFAPQAAGYSIIRSEYRDIYRV